MPTDRPKCGLCGEPMPPGEGMFNFHGYSGPCPAPPLPRKQDDPIATARAEGYREGLERAAQFMDERFPHDPLNATTRGAPNATAMVRALEGLPPLSFGAAIRALAPVPDTTAEEPKLRLREPNIRDDRKQVEAAAPPSTPATGATLPPTEPPPAPESWIVDGALCWYRPSSALAVEFAGVVDGTPRLLGGTWVVHLREMSRAYNNGKGTVPAAACDHLTLRATEAARGTPGEGR